MSWTDPNVPSSLGASPAPPTGGAPPPVPSPLPPFQPHASTTSDGTTVDDTETSDPGVLGLLLGSWSGQGLNVIWTPSQSAITGSDRFLQLAATEEVQEYVLLDGLIPNRGLNQPDLFMSGIRYTQQISSNGKALHFEDGVWLSVPATTVPPVVASVARMASIPHGTTLNAQGTASATATPAATIPVAAITPFTASNPGSLVPFPEQDLSATTQFRTPDPAGRGFDQATIDDVNTFLRARVPQAVSSIAVVDVSTAPSDVMPGGGTANTAFLGPNAKASEVRATTWLFSVGGEQRPSTMLYSQTVLLDFNGLSWPHITVGALARTS